MTQENYTKDEHYTEVINQSKKDKADLAKELENIMAMGDSDFASGYNTALAQIIFRLNK